MSSKKEIILKQTENTKYILYALSAEEFEYMFFNKEKFNGTVITFGEPKQYDSQSLINFIPTIKIENKIENKKEKLEENNNYICYNTFINNLIKPDKENFTHNTPLSSFYCALNILNKPSYICIIALDLDETFNFNDFKNDEEIKENNTTIKTNIFNTYDK